MDGPPPVEEDFSGLPIADRLAHKNWKARVNGYEYLTKAFGASGDESDPIFRPYLQDAGILKKMVTDANAVAQEKGIDAAINFVKFGGEPTARTREVVVPALVDKCFGSSRQATKQKAISLALDYIEVENNGEGVVHDILPGLGAKQPKTVAATAAALNEAIAAFGVKVVAPGPIFKIIPKIFGHSDKTVRAEGTNIVLSLYAWIGPALLTSLSELKPVQVKELTESFETADKNGKGQGTGHQERFTKQQQREREAASMNATADDAPPEEPEVIDMSSLVEPVDIMPKIPQDFHTQISSSKWKDRKETLDAVFEIVKVTPRIVDSDGISELVKALANRMPDANINVVIVAASIIGLLAKGIGQPFGRFKTTVVPPMLERLKERKPSVVDAIGAGLDDFFTTITFPDLTEEFIKYLKHKNPQVREGTLKFLNRSLSTTRVPPNKPDVKPFSEALVELLSDGAEPIRNGAQEGLALFMKIFGERLLNPYLDPVDDLKKGKVKEAFEKATVKCKAGGAPAPPPPAPSKPAPAAAPPKRAPIQDIGFEDDITPPKPLAKPPARLLARKAATETQDSSSSAPPATPAKPPPPAAAAKKLPPAAAAAMAKVTKQPAAAASSASASAPSESFKYKFTPEDADGRIAELIPENFSNELGDGAWKIRLATLDESFPQWLEDSLDTVDAELIFRFLGKKPGWNEKNFQVSAKVYGIMATVAERSPSFSKACIALCASHLTDKLGDIKLKKPASDALLIFAEKTSLAFVLGLCYDPIAKQKAPKNYSEGIAFFNTALKDFGIVGLTLRPMVDFLKQALSNSNAAVRTSATTTLVTLRLFAGPAIKDLLEGLSPQLLTTITSEFDKAEGQPAPTPTRISADVKLNTSAPGAKGKAGGDPMDELFPRADLEKIVAGTKIIEDARSEAWKTRKEALETLQALLGVAANKRLKSNLNDIAAMLKPRLTDLNKSVQASALDVVSRIALGMNKPFEKYCRILVPPITQAMADRSTAVRVAAANTLTAIATACEGLDAMAPAIGTGLEATNPVSRSALLGWMDSWIKENGISPSTDLSGWAAALILCLDDKTADVRKGALAVLPPVINAVGYDRVADKTSALKPASRAGVLSLLQTANRAAETLSPPAAAPPPPPPKSNSAPPASAPQPVVQEMSELPAPVPPRKGMLARRLIAPSTSRPASRAESPDPTLATPSASKTRPLSMKRPAAVGSKPAAPLSIEPASTGCPFIGANSDPKRNRLAKDANRWIVETGPTRKDLSDLLLAQMEGHVARDILGMLFSHDHNAVNDHIAGLSTIADAFAAASEGEGLADLSPEDLQAILLANIDLPLKYVTLKIHDPQPNLISKCLDVVETIVRFLISSSYVLTDAEALSFVPTVIHKLGDAREIVRHRVQGIIQSLPKAFSSSRLFTFLLEQGLRSKVNKTRQGALDEMASMIKKKGMAVCDPVRAFPVIASMVGDKDPATRKSALSVIGEAYILDGEKVWSYLGRLDAKIQTQVEERLRRMPGPSKTSGALDAPVPAPVSRLASALPRPASPSGSMRRAPLNGLGSPTGPSRMARPSTPPPPSQMSVPLSPSRSAANATPSSRLKPLQSRLAPPKARASPGPSAALIHHEDEEQTRPASPPIRPMLSGASDRDFDGLLDDSLAEQDEITITISSILSGDPSRSVDALKKLQKTLDIPPEAESSSFDFQNLANHTDGLVETIVLQMGHVWDRGVSEAENYRLAKHLIQTLNTFCEHPILAESLPVDILTSLLEELTLRLLQSDESDDTKVKDLSRFINMIILKLFDTARRINVFRALFNLLTQITKPFTAKRTAADSREARLAELVLKCLWKLARAIPANLQKETLDPVEMFPALELFLQSIPPNEWRARAQAKVPCGDMPLRTIKVIIQHIVGAYGDEVYDYLSRAFDDPSATIVYPYVYRTLNNAPAPQQARPPSVSSMTPSLPPERAIPKQQTPTRPVSSEASPPSPPRSGSIIDTARSESSEFPSRRPRSGSTELYSRPITPPGRAEVEPDLDARLVEILDHISSETTGALHKEGITELYHFLKSHPEKQARVDRMLDATGPQFRKYLARALASRAAEDEERRASVAQTLSRLESGTSTPASPRSPTISSPKRGSTGLSIDGNEDRALSRLHDIFHYQGRSSVILDSRRVSLSSSLNGGVLSHDPPLRNDTN